MVAKVKARLGYDDSLDAFGVHGAGGTLGALLTGVFASSAGNPFVGLVIAWGLAAVGTLIILKIVDATVGLRVSEEHEIQGLDLSQHGEEGYYWEVST